MKRTVRRFFFLIELHNYDSLALGCNAAQDHIPQHWINVCEQGSLMTYSAALQSTLHCVTPTLRSIQMWNISSRLSLPQNAAHNHDRTCKFVTLWRAQHSTASRQSGCSLVLPRSLAGWEADQPCLHHRQLLLRLLRLLPHLPHHVGRSPLRKLRGEQGRRDGWGRVSGEWGVEGGRWREVLKRGRFDVREMWAGTQNFPTEYNNQIWRLLYSPRFSRELASSK